jgi:hypothetical protein
MGFRQPGEPGQHGGEVCRHQVECRRHLQDERGVDQVLARRAEMQAARHAFRQLLLQCLEERDRRHAGIRR